MEYLGVEDTVYLEEQQNGRVVAIGDDGKHDNFILFDENNNNDDKFKNVALQGIQILSPLSVSFFSKYNMKRLQDLIRYNVFKRSNGKYRIGEQSNIELQIIMRAMYLQYAKNLSCGIKKQIDELNQIIVSWAVPKILGEIEQYNGYLYETQNLPIPIAHPKNISSKGTRTLRSVTSTF